MISGQYFPNTSYIPIYKLHPNLQTYSPQLTQLSNLIAPKLAGHLSDKLCINVLRDLNGTSLSPQGDIDRAEVLSSRVYRAHWSYLLNDVRSLLRLLLLLLLLLLLRRLLGLLLRMGLLTHLRSCGRILHLLQ